MKGFYTGIGSRESPPEIMQLMTSVAAELSDYGYVLRSGHAPGADIAFEVGCLGKGEIYLPWASFNKETPVLGTPIVPAYDIRSEDIAMKFHPNWNALSDGGKRLMNRNSYQVLGQDLMQPSHFVLCWTPGGKPVGGTSQALRIAAHAGIPIFNLFNNDALDKLLAYIEGTPS